MRVLGDLPLTIPGRMLAPTALTLPSPEGRGRHFVSGAPSSLTRLAGISTLAQKGCLRSARVRASSSMTGRLGSIPEPGGVALRPLTEIDNLCLKLISSGLSQMIAVLAAVVTTRPLEALDCALVWAG